MKCKQVNTHSLMLKIVLMGFVFLSGFSQGQQVFAGERVDANLEVEDVLSLPGERMQLQAFLFSQEAGGKRIGVGDESVEFFIQKRSVGKSVTGGDGKAFLEFVPRLRGNLTIEAHIHGSARVPDLEASGLLAAWEKRRPILLVDIVALLPQKSSKISSSSLVEVTTGQTIFPDPNSDARDELEKLGKFYYNLVYLSRLPDTPVKSVRDWLRQHQLPTGVPMAIQPGSPALISFIEKLKNDGWENVESGIGRSTDFAEVLLERRIQTVIIQESETDEQFPRRAKIVTGWKKVRRHL